MLSHWMNSKITRGPSANVFCQKWCKSKVSELSVCKINKKELHYFDNQL